MQATCVKLKYFNTSRQRHKLIRSVWGEEMGLDELRYEFNWKVNFACHRHLIPYLLTVHLTLITTDVSLLNSSDYLRKPPSLPNPADHPGGKLRQPPPASTSGNTAQLLQHPTTIVDGQL